MSEWKIKSFNEIAEFPPKVKLEKGNTYSFIPMEVITGNYKYVEAETEKEWKGSGGAKFEDGDTLFARITPCLQNGKIAQAKNLKHGKGFGSTEYFIFRGIKGVSDSDFIFYLSQTNEFRQYAIGSMVGASGRQRADATFVGNFQVDLPPLPTQRKIASILSAYDDLIENNLKRIKLLGELAQRTYEEWFVKFRVNGKELAIGENGLPVGWNIQNIGSLISYEIGGGWGDDTKSVDSPVSGYVIRGTDIDKLSLGNANSVPYRFHKRSNMASRQLQGGDIVFEVSGGSSNEGVAKSLLITQQLLSQFADKVMCASFCKLVRPSSLEYSNFLLLTFKFFRKVKTTEIWEIRSASNIVNYNWTAFLKFQKVKVPNENVLKSFNKIVDPISKQISILASQNCLLKASRDTLLPRLMSGKISVEEALGMVAEESNNYSKIDS